MKYEIYIKSHCEAPDFESEIEASSDEEAVDFFYNQLKGNFDKTFIRQNMQAVCESCNGEGVVEVYGGGDGFDWDVVDFKSCPNCT